jgi:hypothetical protein
VRVRLFDSEVLLGRLREIVPGRETQLNLPGLSLGLASHEALIREIPKARRENFRDALCKSLLAQ